MKHLFAAALVSSSVVIAAGGARAADDFAILPEVYGSCIVITKSPDGSSRNDCVSSASIFNAATGSTFYCDAHLVVNIEGVDLKSSAVYKKADCKPANQPTHTGAASYSVGTKFDPPPRHSPNGNLISVPSRFYWITPRDKLAPEVCFDFVGYQGFSGCIPATLPK